jgi:hypothetical protein
MLMNIKNINQILKVNDSQRSRLFEGSIINGKILSNNEGKGAIKLYDGTIIPAIFISDKTPDSDKNIKFIIQGFDGENFIVKVIGENAEAQNEKSLNSIIRDLNIPFKDGKDIIMSLIKFNLPATNENMNGIFKNMTFLDNLKNMTDSEILLFLKEHVDETISQNSQEFVIAKNVLSDLKNIDLDFLSFMKENDIPHNLDNIFKTQDFMNNKFFLNSFIDNIKNAVTNLDATINKTLIDLDLSNLDVIPNNSQIDINKNNLVASLSNTPIDTDINNLAATNNNPLADVNKNNLAEAINADIIDIDKNNFTVSLNKDVTSIGKDYLNNLSQISKKIEILLSNNDNDGIKLLSNVSKKNIDVILQLSKKIETILLNTDKQSSNQLGKLTDHDLGLLSKLDKNIKALVSAIDNNSIKSEKEELNSIFTSISEKDSNDILSLIDKNIKALLLDTNKKPSNSKVPESEILSQIEKDVNTLLANKTKDESSKFPVIKKTETETATAADTKALTQIKKDIKTLISDNGKNGNQPLTALSSNAKASLSKIYKNIETLLSNIDNDTLSSINEDLNSILNNIEKSGDSLLSRFTKLASTKPMNSEKLIINSIVQLLSNKTDMDKKNLVVASLEDTINIFKENKEMFTFISGNTYEKLLDNLDIFKQMNNNYNLYFFNLYDGNNIFKNNIIIKNKFKGSKFVDVNDVKAFISVDTKDIGTVEGNLYKKNNDISISFNVNEKFLPLFRNSLNLLKEELKKNGYDIINLSVVKSNCEKNILPFSDFFNDSILKELDVKV